MAASEEPEAGAVNQAEFMLSDLRSDSGRSRLQGKSVTAFRTISEVSTDLEIPQHVLRFWESKFTQLRPLKRGGGRRYYRPEDIALLRRIHGLLYGEGYTIKGVQQVLRNARKPEAGPSMPAPAAAAEAPPAVVEPIVTGLPRPPPRNSAKLLLSDLLAELKHLRRLLD